MPAMIARVEGRAVLQHLQQDRAIAVHVHDVGLRRIAVAHLRHVAQIDHRALLGEDRQVGRDRRKLLGALFEVDGVLEAADLLRADRRQQVLRGERVGHVVGRRSAKCLSSPPGRGRSGSAGTCRRTGEGIAAPGTVTSGTRTVLIARAEHRLLGHALARQRELDDRHRRGVEVQDQGRRDVGRHLLQHGLRDRGDLCVGDS